MPEPAPVARATLSGGRGLPASAGSLEAFQRLAGNRVLAHDIAQGTGGAVSVQRQPEHGRTSRSGPQPSPAADVVQLRASTQRTVQKLGGLRQDLRDLGDRYEDILGIYDIAYGAYSRTVDDAQEEAEATAFFLDLALDVVLAVLPVIGAELRAATRGVDSIAPAAALAQEAQMIEVLSTEVAESDVRELFGGAEFGFGAGELERGSAGAIAGRAEGAAIGGATERGAPPAAESGTGGGFGGRTGDARASLEHLLLGLTRETLELHGRFTDRVPRLVDAAASSGQSGDVGRLSDQLTAIDQRVDAVRERVRYLARRAQGIQQVRTWKVWERYLWVLWISRMSSWPWMITPDALAHRLKGVDVLGPSSMGGEPGMLGYDPESVFGPVDREMILQRARAAAASILRSMSIAD